VTAACPRRRQVILTMLSDVRHHALAISIRYPERAFEMFGGLFHHGGTETRKEQI